MTYGGTCVGWTAELGWESDEEIISTFFVENSGMFLPDPQTSFASFVLNETDVSEMTEIGVDLVPALNPFASIPLLWRNRYRFPRRQPKYYDVKLL